MAATTVQKLVLELQSRGVNATAAELEHLASSFLRVEQSSSRSASKLEATVRALDPLTKALAQQERLQRLVNDQVAKGITLEERHTRALKAAQEQVDKARRASGGSNDNVLNSNSWLNLSRQGQDVAVSLAGGQSPLQVLLQQGSQVYDVFASSGSASTALKEFGSTVSRFVLNPITVLSAAVAGVTYVMYDFYAVQQKLETALNGVGRSAGVTANTLRSMGAAGAASGGMTAGQGIEAAGAYAATGRIGGGMISSLVSRTQRYADAFGLDTTDAIQELAKAFADPVKGAEALNERMGLLDGKTREYIKTLKEQGNELGAQKALFDAFDASLKRTTDTTGILTRAWREAKQVLSSPIETLTNAIDRRLNPEQQSYGSMRKRIIQSQADQADILANRQSVEITDRVTKFIPEIGSRKALSDSAAFFNNSEKNTAAMSRLGVSTDEFREAQERANIKLREYKTEAEKVREATDFRVRSITTLNEKLKADIDAEQTRRETLRDTGAQSLSTAKADQVRAEALARVSVAVRDYNDAAKDQLSQAGLTPYQKAQKQIIQEGQKFSEQFGGVPSGVADKLVALQKETTFSSLTQPTMQAEAEMELLARKNEMLGASTEKMSEVVAWNQKYNDLVLQGVNITPNIIEQIDAYAASQGRLAKATEDANQRQQQFVDGLDTIRSTVKDVGESLVNAFRRGENAGQALLSVLDRLSSRIIDKSLDTVVGSLFGKTGSTDAGILGPIAKGLFGFANGGIMTSAGPMPLMAYADGGVANRPQMALFGEGRRPEAFVPLPDGRSIPVNMKGGGAQMPKFVFENHAPGVTVQPVYATKDEVRYAIVSALSANNKRQSESAYRSA